MPWQVACGWMRPVPSPASARAGLEAGIRRCHCCSSETAAPKTRRVWPVPSPRRRHTARTSCPCIILSCVSRPVAWHLEELERAVECAESFFPRAARGGPCVRASRFASSSGAAQCKPGPGPRTKCACFSTSLLSRDVPVLFTASRRKRGTGTNVALLFKRGEIGLHEIVGSFGKPY
jgi:hypothetical protein